MSDDVIGFDDKFDAPVPEYIVHPAGYECLFECREVAVCYDEGRESITLEGNCDGAKVREYIGLRVVGNRTSDIIKWSISAPLVSMGIIKHGESARASLLEKCKGRSGPVRLKVDKFRSNRTGEELTSNKVGRWLPPDYELASRDSDPIDKPKAPKVDKAAASAKAAFDF